MDSLSQSRRVFHSEADFQHSLAWEFQKLFPDASIRLEVPMSREDTRAHVDILVKQQSRVYCIELKYATRQLKTIINGEEYNLVDQAAQDITRYDFMKDIERIERWSKNGSCNGGAAIILTNQSGYWSEPRQNTIDAAFRIHEGGVLQGLLVWSDAASVGTIKGRESPLNLSGTYIAHWRAFSKFPGIRNGIFRYFVAVISDTRD